MTQSPSVFDTYNHTELLQACADAGIVVLPSADRTELIAYLEGTTEPPNLTEADNVFHTWRHGLIGFLNEHWREIETQITCPARALRAPVNPNPRPCFGCLDTKVIDCLIENSQHVPLIDAHRLLRRPVHK